MTLAARVSTAATHPSQLNTPRGGTGWVLMAPALLLVLGFLLTPMIWLVRLSLYARPTSASGSRFYDATTLTLANYATLLTDPFYRRIFEITFWQAALVAVVVMVLAFACAITIHRWVPAAKTAAILAVMLPKMTNVLVLCYGILVLLSNSGLINTALLQLGLITQPIRMFANLFAVVVTEVVIIAPYPILILLGLFQSVDPDLEKAAIGLGARPMQAFLLTTFRITLPGAITAAFISFVWGFGAYIGPVVMGAPDNYTAAVQVFTETFDHTHWPLGAALAVVQLVLIGLVLGAGLWLQRRLVARGSSVLPASSRPPRMQSLRVPIPSWLDDAGDGLARWGVRAAGVLTLALLLIPLVLSVFVAFTPEETIGLPQLNNITLRWFQAFFADALWREGAWNSFIIGVMAMGIALVTGTAAALGLERHRIPGANAITLLLLAPLFVPTVVLGMQSLAWHQRIGLWGQPISIALAHALIAMPLVVLIMRNSIRSVDQQLEQAAQGLGASSAQVFFKITLPLVGPSLFAAAFFAFIISINEFVMTQFLATPRTQTLSTLIWPQLRYNLTPLVAAASAVLLGVTLAVLLMASRLINMRKLL